MKILVRLITSSLGKKFLTALTGVGLFLFVIAHLLGNLQIFLGPESINKYGHFLKSNPEIIWPARIGLLVMVVIHIWTSIALTIENRAARNNGYEVKKLVAASLASRTMIWSGGIIFAFVGYHLAHYTVMTTNPEFATFHDELGRHDVYRMMVTGFRNPAVSGFYVLSVGLLCFHLSHGASAMFQSLGLKNEAYEAIIDRLAKIVAIVLFIGYASIPLAVLTELVK